MIDVRPLRTNDQRDQFFSGDVDLDRFFQKFAGQNQFRLHVGTTYVAVDADIIQGFVTLSATSIVVDNLPKASRKKLPKYPLPALRLARLAVAKEARGNGIGRKLLRATFAIAHEMAERTGCVGVVVDAKPDAIGYYQQYGFEAIEVIAGKLGDRPAPLPMFLPLGSVPK